MMSFVALRQRATYVSSMANQGVQDDHLRILKKCRTAPDEENHD
jgi:hypothetical protein